MTLPGPESPNRWQGRTLVDHDGEPLGSIEVIYLDKVTNQPEWALLEAGATGPARTFVPLVSAGEEGDTVRVPFSKTLVEGAPSMPAGQELSEDQEGELYRHYGIPYSRADSPSGLPAGEPQPAEPALAADQPQPAEEPVSASTPEVAHGKPQVTAEEPTTAAEEPLPAGGGARPEAAVPESAPIPASAVAPASGRVDEPVAEAPAASEGLVASRPLRITDPRAGAGPAAALALAVGIWQRETIGRQVSTSMRQLGAIPATIRRRRRRRRRAMALNQAVTAATQQTTALARGTARLVTGTALLPVTVVVRGGGGCGPPARRPARRSARVPAGFGLAAAEGDAAEPSAWPLAGPPGMCWGPRPAGSGTSSSPRRPGGGGSDRRSSASPSRPWPGLTSSAARPPTSSRRPGSRPVPRPAAVVGSRSPWRRKPQRWHHPH
jgi:hypothetical protein